MKKVLLPITETDYRATEGRLLNLAKSLSEQFSIEFLTISKPICEEITQKLPGSRNISVRHVEPGRIPFTLDLRTGFVKIFVQYTDDIFLPHTNLKLWKTAAFDDFWGHISTNSFDERLVIDTDIVLMPLTSYDDAPSDDADVFYTSIIFKAKEARVKVVGFQLYPVFSGHKLMPRLMDALVVRKEYERQFHIDMGIAADKIHLLSDGKDKYSVTTISDPFDNYLYNDQIPISRDELAVVVFNHMKFRPCIKQIIKAVGDSKVPVVLSFIKRSFVIREYQEDEILAEFYLDDITKTGCRFYVLEPQSIVPAIMVSDLVVSTTYVTPVELAAKYRKKSIVYNTSYDAIPDVEGTVFLNDPDALVQALKKAYEEKKTAVEMADVLNAVLGK